MTTTHQTSRVTGLLFYSGGSANLPLQPIDAVRVDAEGRLVGFHSGKTQAQLQVECGLEIKIAGAETFEELRDAYYTTAPEQITESDFLAALSVLPPMRWGRWLGVPPYQQRFRMTSLAECHDRFHLNPTKNKTYHICLSKTLTDAVGTHRAPKRYLHVLCQQLRGKSCSMVQYGSLKRKT